MTAIDGLPIDVNDGFLSWVGVSLQRNLRHEIIAWSSAPTAVLASAVNVSCRRQRDVLVAPDFKQFS